MTQDAHSAIVVIPKSEYKNIVKIFIYNRKIRASYFCCHTPEIRFLSVVSVL